jgi:hypothetical protein
MLIVYSAALSFLAIRSPSQALALLPLPEEVVMEMAVMAMVEMVVMAEMAMVEMVVMTEMAMVEMVVMTETVMIEMAMEVDKPRSQTPPLMLSSLPSS